MNLRLLGLPLLALVTACGQGTIGGDGEPADKCPAIRVDTEVLEFADSRIGEASARTFTVKNDCLQASGDLTVELSVGGDAGFEVTPASLILVPGVEETVTVTYVAEGYAPTGGGVVMTTNDRNAPQVTVQLDGATDPDQDGDGFTAPETGGVDCDDFDGDVNPGAPEVYYDGVDQNCDGLSDFDADGDGYDRSPEGQDCADNDAGIFPGADEADNLVDDDCDGYVDEAFIRPGDVLITEVMADPVAVFDTAGEWFEIQNASGRVINLRNWDFTDLDREEFRISGDLVLEPGQRWVFGVNGDLGRNGGVEVGTVYGREDMELDNVEDVLALRMGGETVSLLEYEASWNVVPGRSLSLDPMFIEPEASTVRRYWCNSTASLPAGDRGTPSAANDLCAAVDHDGDGFSVNQGDCDDGDDSIYPDAPDVWNGIDDNCDGAVDEALIDEIEAGWVEGETRAYTGAMNGLQLGDVDRDGDLEVVVATTRFGGTIDGRVYTLDAASVDTFADPLPDVDEARIDSHGEYDAAGIIGRLAGDNDGDGDVDLVIGGSSGWASDKAALALFSSARLSGNLDEEDADATWYGPRTAYDNAQVVSHLDMDGDGTAEILFSDPNASAYYGAIYTLDGASASGHTSITEDAARTWTGEEYYSQIGSLMDGADLDGDGYDDLVACAAYDDIETVNGGACYIVDGGSALEDSGTVGEIATAWIGGRSSTERLGTNARLAFGDFDGDTKLDMAIPSVNLGEVLIYLDVADLDGGYDTNDADAVLRARSGPVGFGRGLAVGDFDNDGDDDLAVGAPDSIYFQGYGADEAGAVYVFDGADLSSSSSLDEGDAWASVTGSAVADTFGFVLLAGDLDGDGVDDLTVASPNAATSAGRVSFILME